MLRVPRSEHRQVVQGLWPPPHCLLFCPLSTWNPGPFLALGLPFHPLTAPQSPHKTIALQNLSPTVDMPGIPPSRVVTSCNLELHLGGHLGQTACFKSPGLCRLTGRAAPLAPGWPDHKEKLGDFAPPLGTPAVCRRRGHQLPASNPSLRLCFPASFRICGAKQETPVCGFLKDRGLSRQGQVVLASNTFAGPLWLCPTSILLYIFII